MTISRKSVVNTDLTLYYHCTTRCVRRAFLCGNDHYSGKNYDHRKAWLVERIRFLAAVFSIDVAGFAIMSNHYHVVVRIDPDRATQWDEKEVAARWASLYKNDLALAFSNNLTLDREEQDALKSLLPIWRHRLTDLSWFMRCINEPLARQANQEDKCGGRFWERRFFSQALGDEAALLACLAYVDLNPVRAKLAKTLENCDYTSIQTRLMDAASQQHSRVKRKAKKHTKKQTESRPQANLLPFENQTTSERPYLPGTFEDYLLLVEETGKAISIGKGHLSKEAVPILERLGVNSDYWVGAIERYHRCYRSVAGSGRFLERWAEKIHQQWFWGVGFSKRLYT